MSTTLWWLWTLLAGGGATLVAIDVSRRVGAYGWLMQVTGSLVGILLGITDQNLALFVLNIAFMVINLTGARRWLR